LTLGRAGAGAGAPEVDVVAYLAECRQLAIDEIARLVAAARGAAVARAGSAPDVYELMLEYPLRGAKGLRPALCIAAARALGGGLEAVLPSAAVLELYHNAFLIHDDVEDGSELRRDRPALHREHGEAMAINVGDAMLALALEPLLDNTRVVGLGKALRILQTVARMARETAEGQATELAWIRAARWDLSDDDYRAMVLQKTGWYSFIAPVTLGAIVAGAAPEQLGALQEAARELAIAFQIRDDVLNLAAPAAYGKERGGDLWEGKRTLIALHLMRTLDEPSRAAAAAILARPRVAAAPAGWRALLAALEAAGDLSAAGRARLDACLGAGGKTAAEIAQLEAWVARAGSVEYASAVGRQHAALARAALARAALPPSVHRELLRALVDFTIDREQ
jgi:geranylgeranyl diphosphate synthase type II